MPVTRNNPAPYAPASVITGLVVRHRTRGLPAPITADVLRRVGISDSLIPRTLQALQTLDLVTEEGNPTQRFESLRLASENDYEAALADWLKSAYADAFAIIDPATATDTQVRDAFRTYVPVGQQGRMVTLFLGLCEAAGLSQERKRRASKNPANSGLDQKRRRQKTASAQEGALVTPRAHAKSPTAGVDGLPPALSGLLSSLPSKGETWTRTERDRFIHTFGAVLDFCFPLASGRAAKNILEQEDDE